METQTWYQNPDLSLAWVLTVDDEDGVTHEVARGGDVHEDAVELVDAAALAAAQQELVDAQAADLAAREAAAAAERAALIASLMATTGLTEAQVVAVYGV